MEQIILPRRLRSPLLRPLLQRVRLRRSDIITPVFVCAGEGVKKPVGSMPGVFQMSVDVAVDFLDDLAKDGFAAYMPFAVVDKSLKNATGSEALNPNNLVCRTIDAMTQKGVAMAAFTDLCFCEYTDHGHCGPLTADSGTVDNDATLKLLAKQAVSHARAGADVIAPSGMMDGMIAAIRAGLDDAGYHDVPVLSYAVKYASAFYGPFRDAAESTPAFGDRRTYQMDPARGVAEALREVELDLQQGADMVMVKPAGPYLDVLAAVRQAVNVPVAAYQVSGEYAMIEAAAANGWIDRDRVIVESLQAIHRAGADLILSYFAPALRTLIP